MPRSRINVSRHATHGEVVAVRNGQIAWTGPLSEIGDAGAFDALFCHEEDEEKLVHVLRAKSQPLSEKQ
jgi:hypothetical protein